MNSVTGNPTSVGRAWRPILDGAIAHRAWTAIHTVAKDLDNLPLEAMDASLDSGHAGVAVFQAYLARATGGGTERCEAHLSCALDLVAETEMDASFYGGFSGIAWAVEHLRSVDEEDPNLAADEALLELLDGSPWDGEFDLVSGLVGFGAYALERLPCSTAAACLERVVSHLDETAERRGAEITWFTPPASIPEHQDAPDGYWNLGVAHGVPGVIALLAGACAAGVAAARARPLLAGAIRWLQERRLFDDAGGAYPNCLRPGRAETPARSAWCYGDPGIAATLLVAGRAAGEPAWEDEAIALALSSAARAPEAAGVGDAGLCHGAAGLAHVFNRIHQATGDERLRAAAIDWFERALDLRRPDRGAGGFPAFSGARDRADEWEDQPGLLGGGAGVALALLAAVSPVEPCWDRVLLVSARG